MKKIYCVLLLLISLQVFSQQVSSGIGRWKLGLNVGATWQTADVSTKLFNLGYGATLEYALYERRRSYFGFSLRGRFLQGKTTGYDYLGNEKPISNNAINGTLDTSFNYSFSPLYLNNQTKLNEFSLEAMLKWNRLYQNHGILFYLYLGGGFTSYKVTTDQLDANGSLYDYSLINNNNGSSTVKEIENMQDGVFETELSNPDYNTLVFTPAVGIGLGFRITPGVDFVFEHKISLPQTDLFDGQIHDSGDPSFIQDIYQYSSLGIIFSLVGHTEPETYSPPVEPSEPITVIPVVPITPIKPIITVQQPTTNTFNSPNCKVVIVAKIENVSQQKDITFYHNGNKVPSYKYFFSPTKFKSTVELKEGNNTFKIVAKNGNLSDTEEFSLKCNNVNTITICHKNNDGSFTTLSIKESEWNTHKAHGDTQGACPEKQITVCHNVSGKPGVTETIQIDESKWAIHKSHGDYLGNCQEKKMITICHNNQNLTIDEKDWAIHASHGDIKAPCPQVKMITICHIPTTGNKRQTISIPETEWIVHQAHGDYKGNCPAIEPTTTICHKNSNGTKTTMAIPEFRWNEHFAHGDSKGACPQTSFIICHTDPATGKKQNISIYEAAWVQHAAHGDTKGSCPVVQNQITICHNIPGQPGKTQTISIPESKWLIHKSHGDVKGACPLPQKKITICHKQGNSQSTIVINLSEWAQHAAHGDTKGECPQGGKQITICHNIPGQPGKTTLMTIPESQWSIHQAHGDTKGPCPKPGTGTGTSPNLPTTFMICHTNSNGTKEPLIVTEKEWKLHQLHGDTKGECPQGGRQITICHNISGKPGQTTLMTIDESQWPSHQAHGDTKGPCPKPTGNSGGPNTGSNEKFDICHTPPGGGSAQTIQVTEKEWQVHHLHGDTKGTCNSGKKKETKTKGSGSKKGN